MFSRSTIFISISIITLLLVFNVYAKNTILISDIDDTIKISHILKRKIYGAHMTKSFKGMSELYFRYLCGKENDADRTFCMENYGMIHSKERWISYVTGTPEVVAPFARSFIFKTNFPNGVVFTKPQISGSTKEYKVKRISKILDGLKEKDVDVVLIGDNGQHDVEVYKIIADKYIEYGMNLYTFVHQIYSSKEGVKEQGKSILGGQLPYLTATDLALNFLVLGLINQDDVREISLVVLKEVLSKNRKNVLPNWVQCKEFVNNYSRPNISLRSDVEKVVSSVERAIKIACLGPKQ